MVATASKSAKIGKETVPFKKGKTAEHSPDQEMSDDEGVHKSTAKPRLKKPLSDPVADQELSLKELKQTLTSVSAERDRLRSQRDAFANQFKDLSKLRSTDTEVLLEKYKEKVRAQTIVQNEIIANQTTLTEKLQGKVRQLEKSLAVALEAVRTVDGAKPDPREIRVLKDEMAKIKAESKAKDQKLISLEREYKTEVEHSRSLLQASSTKAGPVPADPTTAAAASVSAEECEKDAASLGLYEDLTLLNIVHVKIKPARFGKERTFNCVMAVNGHSLNFKLRCFTDYDKTKTEEPYVKTVHYTPDLLEHETEAFIAKLDDFATEFVVPREQLGGFFLELRSKMGDDEA